MYCNNITRLAPDVVRKLAAGEFLFRPASAVKELVENSLDARATSIKITVKNGGMKYLQVLDNGSGICKEDLEMLCERHTTSKLMSFEQLHSISTYGFRGEAMASISAVAHVSVTTKTAESRCGYEVSYLEGTMKSNPMPCGANKGTQITVENMFYNMPLRQKGLQKFAEELKKVEKVVASYAVHNPSVSFMLKKLGQKDVNIITPANSTTIKNIEVVFGSEVSRNLLEEEGVDELLQFKYHIVVTNLKYSAPTMKFLLFINHRLVNANGLKEDINTLYNIYLPQKRKPFVYISLEMNPQNVDVNVHPSKEEVFYLHEDAVNKKIISVIKHLITGKEAYKAYQEEIESMISADCSPMSGDRLNCASGEANQLPGSDVKMISSESSPKMKEKCKIVSGDSPRNKEALDESRNSSVVGIQPNNDLEGFANDISLSNSYVSFNPQHESTNIPVDKSVSVLSSNRYSDKTNGGNKSIFKYKEPVIFQRPINRDSFSKIDSFFNSPGTAVLSVNKSPPFTSKSDNNNDNVYTSKNSSVEQKTSENKDLFLKIDSFFSPVTEVSMNCVSPLSTHTVAKNASSHNGNVGGGSNRQSLEGSVPSNKEESLFSSVTEACTNSFSESSFTSVTNNENMFTIHEGTGKAPNVDQNNHIDLKNRSVSKRESCNESVSLDMSVASLGILKMNIIKSCNHLFKDAMRQSTFVKCEDFQFLFIQERSTVYSCDLKYFCQEFFYQLVLDNFQNHRILRFSEPAPLKLLLQVAARSHSTNFDIASLVKRLTSASVLLEDFFSIIIDKEGNLQGIPWLLDEYLPSKKHLPFFVLSLATNVQWDSEFSCIDGVSQQIAKYYSQLPSHQEFNLTFLIQ